MDRSLFAEITAMSMDSLSHFEMPKLRFFEPNQIFWDLLKGLLEKHQTSVLEVGAGNGDLFYDGLKHGLTIQGIDTMRRTGVAHVLIADAVTWNYKPGTLALCCRPDHSGWAGYALERALECGASFMYVGLRHNIERDLNESQQKADFRFDQLEVGQEGEIILGWGPMFAINCTDEV